MQQHRGYASSAQDDETKGGQKSDQHQKQLETGGECDDWGMRPGDYLPLRYFVNILL